MLETSLATRLFDLDIEFFRNCIGSSGCLDLQHDWETVAFGKSVVRDKSVTIEFEIHSCRVGSIASDQGNDLGSDRDDLAVFNLQDFYPAILQYKKLKVGLYRGDKTTSIGTFLGMGVIVVVIAMTVTVIAMLVVMFSVFMLVLAMIVAVSIMCVHSFAMVMISMRVIPMVMTMIGVVSAGNIASGKGTSAEQEQ